jgi:hypothetical protein
LPSELDLDLSARQTGALVRKREVSSAEELLRLVLAYSLCGMPLRHVVAWAEVAGIASLSNVALLKRLRKCDVWMGQILGLKLAERAAPPDLITAARRVRLVDATFICHPGATMSTWCVHLGYDLRRHSIDHIELTDVHGGENLSRFKVSKGELAVGDAAYANRRGIHSLVETGGEFIIKHNYSSLPLEEDFDLFKWLRELPDAKSESREVCIKADKKNGLSKLPVRIVALRKSEVAAEQARRKILKLRSKNGKHAEARALEAAGYTCLLTNTSGELISSLEVLSLYKFRWQIEMAFKRLKSLLYIDDLPTKDPPVAKTYLYAKLLGALMLDDLTERFLAFSPWGYR